MTFTHLHVYSDASMLNASCRVDDLVAKAKEQGMTALALTDQRNVFNAVPFYEAAKKQGIKPILGCEFAFVEDCDQTRKAKMRRPYFLVLLAENNEGWKNICRLVTLSNTGDNYYYMPRIDFAMLEKYKEGVICLTGGLNGPISKFLYDSLDDDGDVRDPKSVFRAEAMARRFLEIFDPFHLYLEVNDFDLPENREINDETRKLALKYGLKTVAAGRVHYVTPADSEAFNTLQMMQFKGPGFRAFETVEYFLKTEEEMADGDFLPDELAITNHLAERCNVEIDLSRTRLPKYPFVPEGHTADSYLLELVEQGLVRKGYSGEAEYEERIKKEYNDIVQMEFSDYFLIVWDVIQWVRDQGWLVGLARGSAGGSLVSYCLGITDLNPMPYGLIWERFLNIGRVGLPDIDVDVPRSKRAQILDYVRQRFGDENVCQLVTLNKLAARAVLKDVFRVFEMPFEEANVISNLVPQKNDDHGAITLDEAIVKEPKLAEFEEKYHAWFTIARALENRYKSIGMHAAAVVIANEDFDQAGYPLCRAAKSDSLIFAYDMSVVDKMKLLKLDLLGLTTLDIIQDTFDLVKERHGVDLSFDAIPLDDQKTFQLFKDGNLVGVFQVENKLGRQWSVGIQPDNIEDIAALLSIIRPGPLESGMAEAYKDVKNGKAEPSYIHPALEHVLSPTHSACIYQEQVIQICRDLAQMSLEDADNVRKAMGKKKPEEMRAWAQRFHEGCKGNSSAAISQGQSEEIWDFIDKFSGYGFNKSHAVGYGLLGYYTAYLKANYTVEFLCACLRQSGHAPNTFEEINKFVNDAKLFDIAVVPPRASQGNPDFGISANDEIVFALNALKGVGARSLPALFRAVKSADMDFTKLLLRMKKEKVNKTVIEACIKSGAFDDFKLPRVRMLADYQLFSSLTDNEIDVITKMMSLPGAAGKLLVHARVLGDEDSVDNLKESGYKVPNVRRREKIRELIQEHQESEPFDGKIEKLGWEKHYLGITLSGSEADMFPSRDKCIEVVKLRKSGYKVGMAVKVDGVRHIKTKKGTGDPMAFMTAGDHTYQLDGFVIFPKVYAQFRHLLEEGNVLRVDATLNERGSLVVDELERLR